MKLIPLLMGLLYLPAMAFATPTGSDAPSDMRPPMRQDIQRFQEEAPFDPQLMQQRREAFRKRAAERFQKMDTDGNGRLSRSEAEAADPRLAKQFDTLDGNRDGELTQEEMRQAFQQRMRQQRQRMDPQVLEKHFTQLDKDGNGRLSRTEVADRPRLNQGFDRLDANRDGEISLDEFLRGRPQRPPASGGKPPEGQK